jgi:hypothetical protein
MIQRHEKKILNLDLFEEEIEEIYRFYSQTF